MAVCCTAVLYIYTLMARVLAIDTSYAYVQGVLDRVRNSILIDSSLCIPIVRFGLAYFSEGRFGFLLIIVCNMSRTIFIYLRSGILNKDYYSKIEVAILSVIDAYLS